MNDHATDPAIAHQQVRAAANNKERKVFAPAKPDQFAQRGFVAWLDPKLRRTADAQRGVFGERLVKTHVAVLTHDLFQFFGDDEIGSQDGQLFVNVARAETKNEI